MVTKKMMIDENRYYDKRVACNISDKVRTIRHDWAVDDAMRDIDISEEKNVDIYSDISYGNDISWQKLDVYRPAGCNDFLPVIVSVHGGGWIYGDKELSRYYTMNLASHGFAVINFSYRLAPEHRFPAAAEDLNSVMLWLRDNAAQYKMDTDNLFAVGDSAGAHGLALYSNIMTNPEYAAFFDTITIPEGIRFKAIALNCGVYNFNTGTHNDETDSMISNYINADNEEKEGRILNTIDFVTRDFPPTFLMAAQQDDLRPQSELFHNILSHNDIDHIFRLYTSKDEKLCHVFHIDLNLKASTLCNNEECAFFKEFISAAQA